jgi:outer membrane usher protein
MQTNSYSFNIRRHAGKSIGLVPLWFLVALCLVAAQGAFAEDEYEFDSSFLQGGAGSADLSKFTYGNSVLPGTYLVDIVLNEIPVGREEVVFSVKPGKRSAEPCLSVALLDRLGVDLLKLPGVDLKNRQACVDLPASVPSASVYFDNGEQRLDLSVPQLNLRRSVQGYVDPSQWDQGVTAGMLNYNYGSFYSSAQQGGTQNFLGLNGGVNLGAWRFRSESSLDWNDTNRNWHSRALYAQRDVQALSSQLTLGDSSTSGNLFDTFALRGVQLASDERMLPDSLRGYAPVVRGLANTNAKVTIRQSGYTVYETTVAPGPFEITDLYPSGYGGDLEVTVTEADGQVRTFSVPYSAVVRMLRPGAQRFSAALGQYRHGSDNDDDHRMVGQLTYERGLTNLFTGYTGVLAAEGYFSPMLGTAMNTPIGAFGLDVTHASTKVPASVGTPGETSTGQSVRLSYSKSMPETGSSVSVAAYRYSTSGFYNLQDAMAVMKTDRQDDNAQIDFNDALSGRFGGQFSQRSWVLPQRQRSSMQVTLNQSLGSVGSMYLTGSTQNYWNRSGSSTQYQLGFTSSTRYFNYSVAAMRSSDATGVNSNQLYATLSIPLGGRVSAISSVSFAKGGNSTRAALNGASGQNNEYNWGTSVAKAENNDQSINSYGSYQGTYGTLNGSLGSGAGYRQASWGASGSVVAHPGGLTLGQRVSDTFGIIEAPDAAGASIPSQPGVKVDDKGYAIVPYLTPYRRNTVDIDPRNMSTDVELKSTSEEVVPRAGAVVMAKFETVKGRAAIIDLELPEGVSIPFGSEVTSGVGGTIGIVGQGGRVLARGLDDKGTLMIKWGESAAQQCQIVYALEPQEKGTKRTQFERFSASCTSTGEASRIVSTH